MPPKPRHTEPIPMPGETVVSADFRSSFETAVAKIADPLQLTTGSETPHDTKPVVSPYLARLADVCRFFTAQATTEEELKLVINTFEERMLDDHYKAIDSGQKGVAFALDSMYRHFLVAAIKLNLFESPIFVSGLLRTAGVLGKERQPDTVRILRKMWSSALGEYLAGTDEEIAKKSVYKANIGLLAQIKGSRQRAVNAVKALHEAEILFEEDDEANFWHRYALSAAIKTPEFLPLLVDYAADPNIFCQIVWGRGIDWRLSKNPARARSETTPVTNLYIRQLLLHYSKDSSRNKRFARQILEQLEWSAPSKPSNLLEEIVALVDNMLIRLKQDARRRGGTTKFLPPPLLVDDKRRPKGVALDHTIVMRALARLLSFTRPNTGKYPSNALETMVLQDHLHSEFAGMLYYGMPKIPADPNQIIKKRRYELSGMRAGHVGALALTYNINTSDIDDLVEQLKAGAPLICIIRQLSSQPTKDNRNASTTD